VNDRAVEALSLRMHHYAIVVPDVDEAVRWYGEKLDFEVERSFGFPEVGTRIVHLTNANGLRIEVIERDGSTAGPDVDQDPFGALLVQGSKHIGFLVEDVEAAADELRRRGVEEFVMEPNVVEPAGVTNFWIRDPAGTLIEFDQWLA
jgi:catechol 2,3-dioxygenase-like lactoylglutathione lyase family enzyme